MSLFSVEQNPIFYNIIIGRHDKRHDKWLNVDSYFQVQIEC